MTTPIRTVLDRETPSPEVPIGHRVRVDDPEGDGYGTGVVRGAIVAGEGQDYLVTYLVALDAEGSPRHRWISSRHVGHAGFASPDLVSSAWEAAPSTILDALRSAAAEFRDRWGAYPNRADFGMDAWCTFMAETPPHLRYASPGVDAIAGFLCSSHGRQDGVIHLTVASEES
jgi:hypothetical protein